MKNSVRCGLLMIALAGWFLPAARATTDEIVFIRLENHWVFEIAGQRFGLIEFDTPSTTVLAGWWDFDVPAPAYAIAAPVAAVPVLLGIALAVQARRRRLGFEG